MAAKARVFNIALGEADPPLRDETSVVFSIAMAMNNERSGAELMRDIDRTLLRENLKLTPAQRLEKFAKFMRFASGLKKAGAAARQIEAKTTR